AAPALLPYTTLFRSDDDRDLGGPLQDVAFEPGLVDVDDEIGRGDGTSAALPGRFGTRLLRLRLGLLGRLHRGEVDDPAHGHVPWLHASILPRTTRACEKRRESQAYVCCWAPGPHPAPGRARAGPGWSSLGHAGRSVLSLRVVA